MSNSQVTDKADKATNCRVTVDNRDWTVTAACEVDRMFASDDEYSSDGIYNYSVIIDPGVGLLAGPSLEISKPNFDNQATTRFWGWVGSKTNLTCIANGNPEPVIEWHKDGQNLASIDDYLITNGNSGLPTRVISYLIPTVANGNVGSVFGSYSCKATNKFGDNTEELTFEQASEPDRVMVKSPRIGANAYEYTLSWDVPMTGGADIENYIVEYAEALEVNTNTEPWAAVRVLPQAQTENIPGQASTSVVLDNLKKNTFYQAKIKAVNSIGTSDETTVIFRTGSGVVPAVSGDDVSESDSLPAIAGGVGGGIVVIIIIVSIIIVFVVVSKRRRAAKKTTSIVSPHEEIHTYANQAAVLNNDRSDDNEDDDFGNYIDIIDDGVADTNQSAVGGESNYELPTRRSQVVDTNIYTGLAEQQQDSTSQGNPNYELPTRRSQVVDTNIYTGLDQETEMTQYQNTATQRPTAQEDTRRVFNQANKNESTDHTDYEIL
ncbi:uncharacterized protein [Littorina saxatilis]|uniref:uncharacterized protein n=1 Tax=Littorina saxatilis TaxID=31220 RepID=UPI0038B5858B